VPAKVAHIEYDPNRTARIALLHYADGEKRYIICPQGCTRATGWRTARAPTSSRVTRCRCADPDRHGGPRDRAAAGRRRQDRPLGGLRRPAAGQGGRLRDAADAVRRDPAGRRECRATVGEVGNAEQGNIKLGKAGRNRWKGKRPSVRGVAMNPVDHPHGGGEGKTSGGRHPVSPWGKPEGRTRRAHKPSDRLISRRRGKNKR
jgi:large subunit ribosomal protein L2